MENRFKFKVYIKSQNRVHDVDSFYIDNFKKKITIHFSEGYTKSFPLNNVVLLQCTGMVDKYKNLIYEGDIVERGDGKRFVIEWCEQKLGFVARTDNPNEVLESLDIYYTPWKIVGNVHELEMKND